MHHQQKQIMKWYTKYTVDDFLLIFLNIQELGKTWEDIQNENEEEEVVRTDGSADEEWVKSVLCFWELALATSLPLFSFNVGDRNIIYAVHVYTWPFTEVNIINYF